MTKDHKEHHAGQKPVTIWLPEALAAQLDRKLADAAQPGLRPSRSGFIMHAAQCALQGAAEAPPAPVPTAPAAPLVAQAVEPAQHAQLFPQFIRPAQLAQDELQVALRLLFQARKIFTGTGAKAELLFRDQDAADLAESAVMADVMYANLLDFARAGAAGLTEAPFCYIADGWANDDGEIGEVKDRSREPAPLFRAIEDIASIFAPGGMFDGLPGPLAVHREAQAKAQAKAREKSDKEAQRAARREARSAKAAARAAKAPSPPTSPPAQLPEQPVAKATEQPALSAPLSPFGKGPSEQPDPQV